MLSDPNDAAYSMRDEGAGLDPSADRARRDLKTFRHLGDREEFDLIGAVMATTDIVESSRFHSAVVGG